MSHILDNPVFNALAAADSHLGFGTGKAKAFDEEVSPFAGFEEGYEKGFEELHALLPAGRYILYATPKHIKPPGMWKLIEKVEGVQMVMESMPAQTPGNVAMYPLNGSHVTQMVELAKLTKPGPFGRRTIEFGHYFGVFDGDRLVAMAGQRMHLPLLTEVSAVCTHPDYLGKGYATALVKQVVKGIAEQHHTPFLHVRADNTSAIGIYQRLGFSVRSPMNFYFMERNGFDYHQDPGKKPAII